MLMTAARNQSHVTYIFTCHLSEINKDSFQVKPPLYSFDAALPCDYSRLGIMMSSTDAYQIPFPYMTCKFRYTRIFTKIRQNCHFFQLNGLLESASVYINSRIMMLQCINILKEGDLNCLSIILSCINSDVLLSCKSLQ